ncbi:hypothetical protein JQC91_07920 [Jannaschia sp. Os4]|uniref:hypothetical protein n=1 Tax=Jannaschia sp. Os4 TaxID=2807617 RepID=UPI001939E67A|nr:hypothetical protein [Jannaschia sp. Os4]MBM2576230.1 hypothetical protein [Jannaschia sp. Os4]
MTITFQHLLAATLLGVGLLSGVLAGVPDERAARASEIEALLAAAEATSSDG